MSKFFSSGVVALTLLTLATTNAGAHNQAKYTGIPFLVPGTCANLPGTNSAQFVTSGGTTQLQLSTNQQAGNAFGEIYCSSPGTPGRSTTDIPVTSSFPEGILTFTVSGLSSGANVVATAEYTDGSDTQVTITSNGPASLAANQATTIPGSPVNIIFVGLNSSSVGTTAAVSLSNFRYSNQPLLLDTTLAINICAT